MSYKNTERQFSKIREIMKKMRKMRSLRKRNHKKEPKRSSGAEELQRRR